MNAFSWAFLSVLLGEALIRLWLGSRQIAAVQASRDVVPAEFRAQLSIVDHRRAADYTLARVQLSRWSTLLDVLLRWALTLGKGVALFQAAVGHLGWREPWAGCVLIVGVFAVSSLLSLPLTIWRIFRLEARFGFNRISPSLFVLDGIKRVALGLLLGFPLLWATLSLMQRAGRGWWLWAWLGWLVTSLTLSWAAPRFIAPLFNRFTAVTDGALKQRIEALVQKCGFAADGGVFIMDASRRSAHGNAYFTGIGRNKRIVFFDTLLSRIEIPEVEAVLAHELGHYRLHHVRQRLVSSLVGSFLGLAFLGWLAGQAPFYAAFGVPATAATALLLFFLTMPPFAFFATPLEAWWSRRQEFAADAFAATHASAADLASALTKLYRDNATTLAPDPVYSGFYDSHPSAAARIRRLRELAARP